MKTIFLLLLLSVTTLSAYALEKPRSHYCMPVSTDISCQLEIALICGDGYIDGCLNQTTKVHKCVLKNEGASCKTPVQILCLQGFRDGCEIGRTTRHQCVPVVGPSCDSGEPFSCPEGFKDLCNE